MMTDRRMDKPKLNTPIFSSKKRGIKKSFERPIIFLSREHLDWVGRATANKTFFNDGLVINIILFIYAIHEGEHFTKIIYYDTKSHLYFLTTKLF